MKKIITSILGFKLLLAAVLWSAWPGAVSAGEVVFLAPGYSNLPVGSLNWRYRLGTAEATTPVELWRSNAFTPDGTWLTGALPIGYPSAPAGDFYESNIVTTLPTSTVGNYLSVFIRKTFQVTNAANFTAVTLGLVVDDGAVVWLNGQEIMRFQCCALGGNAGLPTFDSVATTTLDTVPNTNQTANVPGGPLLEGANVLAIQLFNPNLTSSDLVLDVILKGTEVDTNPPAIFSQTPAPGLVGTLNQISVRFTEPVVGVNAGDLVINGSPATGVSGSGSNYVFTFPQPALGTVNITWSGTPGILDVAVPANEFDGTGPGATWSYTLIDNSPPTLVAISPTVGTAVEELNTIQVNFSEPVTNVDAADFLINGVAATNVAAFSPSIYSLQFAQPPTGAVSIVFLPGGITDLAAALNPFGGSNWTYTLDPNASSIPFLITEFMTANSGSGVNALRDEDGDSSDWIEIYNPLLTVANVGGYFLTDAAANLTKWRIPNGVVISSKGYLVVFASGKNRTNALARLHTNFQLNNGGEYLGLVNFKTNVISEYFPIYPPQSTDVSYGRDRLTPSVVGFYTVPTPGSNNVSSGAGFGPEVDFSVAGCTYATSFQLALTVPDPSSVIRYTIVNSAQDVGNATNIPIATSTLYTGPITINNTVQIRARAFPTNAVFFPGPPRSECYVLVAAALTNFESSLPIVVIHTVNSAALSSGFPALDNSVIIQVFDNTATNGRARLMAPPQLSKRGGINLRGSSTQGFPKSSYAVELWDEFNTDEESSFAGLPKESDWVLYAPNQFDTSLMHNPLLHHFPREMGYYSSRTRFVEVFVHNGAGAVTGTTNATGTGMGDYVGVYVLEEKVKRDGNRVDIDEVQFENTNYPSITGGYLLKIDRTDGNERTFAPGGVTVNYQDPDGLEMVTPARASQAAYINNYFTAFHNSLQGATVTNATGTNHYSNYLNIDETIDYHIMNVLTLNVDGYRLSGYIYKPRSGKIVFGPLWDVDRGLGTTKGDGRPLNPRCWQASNPSGNGGTDNGTDFFQGSTSPSWLGRMFADLDFWQRWIDRYQEWSGGNGILSSNHVNAVIDQFAAELNEAQVREAKRWVGGGSSDTGPRNGTLTTYNADYTHTFNGTYAGEIAFQKRWIIDRIQFFDTNLLARPGLSVAPGLVASGTVLNLNDLTGKAGTAIYYTLDGSDPRAPQGLTNPAAILYAGPVTITNNVRVRARAVNASHSNQTGITGISGAVPAGTRNPVLSSRWSGEKAGTYYTIVPPLIVTELMYHPPGPTSESDTNDADNFEYIELKNIGTNALNLAGFRFTNGIDFLFGATNGATVLAPGGYIVVAKNTNSFTQRFGYLAGLAGPYGGNFDNSGERVAMVGPALEPVFDFVYSDAWFELTDGGGFALVVQNDGAVTDLSTNTSWRSSSVDGGSPGAANPSPVIVTDLVVITEALTHTDLPALDTIELFNAGTNDAVIGGWWLSDDKGNPKKYEIPPGTILPAGSFITFDEDLFNPGGTNGFALSSSGDEVWVFSGTNGFITGYYQGYDFGAAQNGQTFGRHTNSQGAIHFVAQAANTLGTNNSLPFVGPVTISEIMYHPPESGTPPFLTDNSLDEFIELHNITSTNVPLYHGLFPVNTWQLSGGVDFTFPTNVSIAPTSYVVVVSFNPAVDGPAFRARYGVAPEVPLYGPYSGKLDNSGERVRLSRPDAPNGRDVPQIRVDQVDYADLPPWNAIADGLGASLQRLVVGDYGNDATNWNAAAPTPGSPVLGGAPPIILQQPQDITVIETSPTNISVVVSSATPVTYQWWRNSNAVPGAISATLNFPSIQLNQAGTYHATIFNGGGGLATTSAAVNVVSIPAISLQPASTNVPPGSNFNFQVQASGTGPLLYQWRFNGVNINGGTNPIIYFTNAQLTPHTGLYDVFITDNVGTRFSQIVTGIVLVRPGISNQIVAKTVLQGQNATFSLVAGPIHPLLPLTYRWLTNGVGIATSSVPSYTFVNVQLSRSVRVNVVNLAGNVNSSTVQLTVLTDTDGDGIPDSYESSYPSILNSGNPADGGQDPDTDQFINLHEYIAGTVPTNGASYLRLEPLQFLPGNNAILQFAAVSNRTYGIDFQDTLANAWTNLYSIAPVTTNRSLSFTNNYTTPTRFYRVQIPPAQ